MGHISSKFTRLKNKSLGFTIIEIMIVIAVIGILGMVTVPKYQGVIDRYRLESSAQIVATQLRNAKQYAMDRRTDVYVMFNSTTVQTFYFHDDVKKYIPLETPQIFDSGITFKSSSTGVGDIPANGGINNIPPYDKCLIFDRKGFLKVSPLSIVLTNNRTSESSVSVRLISEALAVRITWE